VQSGTTVTTSTVPCGSTSTDVCSPFLKEAYSQTMPDAIWDLSSMPKWTMTMTLPNTPDTGEAFVGPTEVELLGLSLTNPTGVWPSSYTDSAITWLDHDGDGHPGVTSNMLNTGTSSACNFKYANLPITANAFGQVTVRATKVYTGSRSLGNVNGSIIDCNTIKGTYVGPNNGMPQAEGHVVGCITDVNNNRACTDAETKTLDDGGAGMQQITGSKFTLARVADNITCAQVRAMTFP
jgi:hypothetical protein